MDSMFPTHLLEIKATLWGFDRQYLDAIGEKLRPSFSHVCRGDYLAGMDYRLADPSLLAGFYHAVTNELARRMGETHIGFITDDRAWVDENISEITNKSTASFDAETDSAIRVLSNRTFS